MSNIKYKALHIGDKIGRWEIIDYAEDKITSCGQHQKYWKCRCSCEKQTIKYVSDNSLKRGGTHSCGCLIVEQCKKKVGKILSMSFNDWCIANNHQDFLDLWDYELNKISPNDVSYCSENKYYFKCPFKKHESSQKLLRSITEKKSAQKIKCKYCESFAQRFINTFGYDAFIKYWDENHNNINPWQLPKSSKIRKVYLKCDIHESYQKTIDDLFENKLSCPLCSHRSQNGEIYKEESLGELYPKVLNIWSKKNQKNPYQFYPNSGKKVWWKCEDDIHDDYQRKIYVSKQDDFRCPMCSNEKHFSILQQKVTEYVFSKYNYNLLHEYNCNIIPKNPKTKHTMPFDNELQELKLIIEVHGEQHYKINGLTIMIATQSKLSPEEELKQQQWRDNYKKEYALKNGYHYLEIPYWSINDDLYKRLIDDKIQNILKRMD